MDMPDHPRILLSCIKKICTSVEFTIGSCLVFGALIVLTPQISNSLLIILLAILCAILYRYKSNYNQLVVETSELRSNHRILLESVQKNPTPFAVYDTNDRLIAWNTAYESLYDNSFARLNATNQDQIYYHDLVRSNASIKLSGDELERYIDDRVLAQRNPDGSTFDREYPTGGWFRVSKFVTPSGGVAGFAIDINELKQRESELIEEIDQRRQLEVKILALANSDSLTGIYNRRHFMEKAEWEFNTGKDANAPIIVMMIDIDHFKQINDQYGHASGDEVIRFVAMIGSDIAASCNGVIGRLGGEEFAMTISNNTLNTGIVHAEEMRTRVNNKTHTVSDQSFNVSISIGVACQEPGDSSLSELLGRADKALYTAKADGRNRTANSVIDNAA